MGSRLGAVKVAATRLGIPLDEYIARIEASEKWCRTCRQWRPLDQFHVDRSRGSGRASVCGRCRRRPDRPSPAERAEKAAIGLGWCRRCKCWQEGVWAGLCRMHANEAAREWYARAGYRTRRGRASARRRKVAEIPSGWRSERWGEFLGLCAYGCGRPAATADHVIPVSRGGISHPANVVPACSSCNSRKGASDPVPWIVKGLLAFPDQWVNVLVLAAETAGSDVDQIFQMEAA